MTFTFTGDSWKRVHSKTMISCLRQYDQMKMGVEQKIEYDHLVKMLKKRGIDYEIKQ